MTIHHKGGYLCEFTGSPSQLRVRVKSESESSDQVSGFFKGTDQPHIQGAVESEKLNSELNFIGEKLEVELSLTALNIFTETKAEKRFLLLI